MAELQILDWVIVAATVFFAIAGLFRGFSGEIGSVAGWAALAAAAYFGWWYFQSFFSESWMAIFATAVFALVSFWIVRVIVSKIVNLALSQPTDAIVGMVLGAAKVAAAAAVMLYFEIGVEYSRILTFAASNISAEKRLCQ